MANLKEKTKKLIEAEKIRIGSYEAVAHKCGVSPATITLIMQDRYGAEGDTMLAKIISELSYGNNDNWVIVPNIINCNSVVKVATEARKRSMFIAMANKAGSGKSVSLKHYYGEAQGGIYYLECDEWGKRKMLQKLCKCLGIEVPKGYLDNDDLSELIYEYFRKRIHLKPQLIIDQANKLKPSALQFFIPLFNNFEDRLSVVFSGTEHLEKDIDRGVQYAKKGYDEISSRFGRKFIHLTGATLADVKAICTANGVTDSELHKLIFTECGVVQKVIENRNISVVDDLRRLKRIVQRYQLLNQTA